MPAFFALISSRYVRRSVAIRPGNSELTRIRSGASSTDSVLTSEVTPARITFDSARFGNGSFTVDEVPTRIAPPPRARIDGTTRRTVRITLSSSSSNAFCHAMSSKLSAVPAGGPPVFANSRSTPPNRSVVAAVHRVIASALLKSAGDRQRPAAARRVDRRRRPLDARPRRARRSTTCAPSAASARATAKPSPLLAPPTIATLFVRPRSMGRYGIQRESASVLATGFATAWTRLPQDSPHRLRHRTHGRPRRRAHDLRRRRHRRRDAGRRRSLAPLLVSVLLAYALEPFVAWSAACRLPRTLAIAVVFALLIAGLVGGRPARQAPGRRLRRRPARRPSKSRRQSIETRAAEARPVEAARRDGTPPAVPRPSCKATIDAAVAAAGARGRACGADESALQPAAPTSPARRSPWPPRRCAAGRDRASSRSLLLLGGEALKRKLIAIAGPRAQKKVTHDVIKAIDRPDRALPGRAGADQRDRRRGRPGSDSGCSGVRQPLVLGLDRRRAQRDAVHRPGRGRRAHHARRVPAVSHPGNDRCGRRRGRAGRGRSRAT